MTVTESEKIALPLIEKLIVYRDELTNRNNKDLLADACNTISSLRATCTSLRAALAERDALLGKVLPVLEPFATESHAWKDEVPDNHRFDIEGVPCLFRVGDLRRAASLASELKEKQP